MEITFFSYNKDTFSPFKKIFKIFFLAVMFFGFTVSFAQNKYSFDVKVIGKGTPVIMIPGYSCSSDVWKETVDHLKNKFECHILTLAGFAGQPSIKEPLLETTKNEIIAYAKDKKLKNPVIIGHSLGGFLSLWVSSTSPELFKKVIVVDGVPFYTALQNPDITSEQAKQLINKETFSKQYAAMTNEQLKTYAENIAKQLVTDLEKAKLIAEWQAKSDRNTLAGAFYEMMTTDIRSDLSKITAPVLVLGSKFETLENSKKQFAEQYKNVKNLILHIADSKHFIMYDQPEWFFQELDTFLK
ncbi:alpha/beta hydrolase [Elizabethkingia bruuniana]|uniref:Alpha/beta hydrolase n=1 Tax=Elizabethkingia bruuniana TaxID=1756149 RepID=A0A7T7UVI0_9FLAO|nr:alpha/beta hydrolase [Elizabethkingia bruuniana]AQX83589.1 hypothetical protein AYC65_00485 [Elizabethkingia bruuniana]KUY22296.1 hypothetical protein ATB97_13710 [Elizabethkingia bruuniana]OPB62509.1 hypothetical protein BAY12_11450 [Elizabethkingia bruuniana]QQN56989.1 alpha/beta hydrolase [Elizabethkingia bruuniana]